MAKLPDFVIVGGQKCGTTSAILNLSKHPEINLPIRWAPDSAAGEIHFFSRDANWKKGVEWYAEHFRDSGLSGEKTPNYMFQHEAMARMASVIPDTKIIACIRCPVRRFLSQVKMRLGRSLSMIEEALSDPEYLRRGLWHQQIVQNILPFFAERQVKIIIMDEQPISIVEGSMRPGESFGRSAKDESGVVISQMRELFDFLDVPFYPADYGIHHIGKTRPPQVPDSVVGRLIEYYAEDTEQLESFLDRRLSTWEHRAAERAYLS